MNPTRAGLEFAARRARQFVQRVAARVGGVEAQLAQCRQQLADLQLGWPPGHFYSPIPSLDEVRRREGEIFRVPREIPGVELQDAAQIELFHALSAYYSDQPFPEHRREGTRFFFENPMFSYGEALILHAMMRHLRPRRIIEIGSGYSSCAMLDTAEHFLGGAVQCTFIEPYPDSLRSLVGEEEFARLGVIALPVQDVGLEPFAALEVGDILFVDSTHVSKIGSDVNHIIFHVLPMLQSGVYVHFHDVPYPFEYSREWIYEGRAWNEAYLLRAFLQYNQEFRIAFFNSYFGSFHSALLGEEMPLALRGPGSSLWLRKS